MRSSKINSWGAGCGVVVVVEDGSELRVASSGMSESGECREGDGKGISL